MREPRVFSSVDGVLDLLVIAKPAVIAQFAPYQPTGWVYEICPRPTDGTTQCPATTATDNLYGGSRLQFNPGDLLKIRLVNQLPPFANTGYARPPGETFLTLNPTNLHFHGMLVSPRYATADDPTWGDNVFVYNFNSANGRPALDSNLHGTAVYDVVDYSVQVPSSHPAGFYWFHPHVHGIFQDQVAAGLSGILTVGQLADYACAGTQCGANDSVPLPVRHLILKDAEVLKDGTLLTQTMSNFCNGAPDASRQGGCAGVSQPSPTSDGEYPDFGGGRWFFTVNGQQYPTITVDGTAGQVWRILNSSGSATYSLNVWDPLSQREMLMRVVSIDGVTIDVAAGTDATLLAQQAGNRFGPLPCPGTDGLPSDGVCTSTLYLMPSSRAEVWVAYRDANGVVSAPPPGAAAVLRTSGAQTGPQGDTWPAIDLAAVEFAPSGGSRKALVVKRQAPRAATLQRISANMKAANSDVPSDPTCTALAPGHQRRIFLNMTSTAPYFLGLGYEEVDEAGTPVPGTFRDVAPFDPTTPTVCLPLAPGNLPVTERWELVNLSGSDHNFHIHQAHFSVVSESEVADTGVPEQLSSGQAVMMDSLPLLHADGVCASVSAWRSGACTTRPATIQISFEVAGDFVYHCHIAEHEDAGMMAVIRVRSAAGDASSEVMPRLLSALGITGGDPRQPLTPRIGGLMCRAPRPPHFLGSTIGAAP